MAPPTFWRTARFEIDLSRPRVMGIVNATPDSFAGAGCDALAMVDRHADEGADIIDIGGESTRPGAAPVPAAEELRRVLPVLRHALRLDLPVSVDTRHCEVMRAVLDEGADIINDVQALRDRGAEDLLCAHPDAGICLMHMRGDPAAMQHQAMYVNVVDEVKAFLQGRAEVLLGRGVRSERIVLDPGIGFAKTDEHNLALHGRQIELLSLGFPLLVGWSRKSTLGRITGQPVDHRLAASVACALASIQHGASIVRVHDVAATVDALKVWHALGMPSRRSADGSTGHS